MNIFITQNKFKNPLAKQDFLHLVAILKITLHKAYQKNENILDYTEEKKVIKLYNKTLEAVHLTNKRLNRFHSLRRRLISKEDGKASESLLSTYLRITRNPIFEHHSSQPSNMITQDELDIYEILYDIQHNDSYIMTNAQKAILDRDSRATRQYND